MPDSSRPSLVVFDVNQTLSDMAPLAGSFAAAGLREDDAATWFAGLLRDGFALTALGDNPTFAALARESLAVLAAGRPGVDADAAVEQVLSALGALRVHDDVPEGIRRLHEQGLRQVTLGNGAASLATGLLERAGLSAYVERALSVEDAAAWKPDPRAYEHALRVCGTAADDAVLVAVHPWDIEGAHRAGLRTAWLNRSGARYPSYFHAPGLEVASLPELADRLAG